MVADEHERLVVLVVEYLMTEPLTITLHRDDVAFIIPNGRDAASTRLWSTQDLGLLLQSGVRVPSHSRCEADL